MAFMLIANVMFSCLLLFYFKIMTAVTSHQHLPKLIDEMPPGCAKDLVFQLCGHSDRLGSHHEINISPEQYFLYQQMCL